MLLRRRAYPYQRDIIRWARGQDHIGLFLEMRLGKSLIAIRWAERLPAPRLIVCPLSVVPVWLAELGLERHRGRSLLSDISRRPRMSEVDWFVINYDGLFTHGPELSRYAPGRLSDIARQYWPTVILDESVIIKNPKSLTTRIVLSAFERSKHRAILSGLPNPESELDFFTQMQFLQRSFMGCSNFWGWRQKYFVQNGYDWCLRIGNGPKLVKALAKTAVSLTRFDVGMANVKVYERRYVRMPAKVQANYDKFERDCWIELAGMTYAQPHAVGLYATLAQIAHGYPKNCEPLLSHNTKLYELLSLLSGELRGEKVVVWCRHLLEMAAVRKGCESINRRALSIAGVTPVDCRARYIKLFAEGKIDTLVIQLRAGAYGIDLSAASAAVYFSNDWSTNIRSQTEDRLEHPTRQTPILIIDLVTVKSIDEDIHWGLRRKRKQSGKVLRYLYERIKERCQKESNGERV